MIADTPFLLQSPGPGGGVCNRAGFYAKTFRSPVGVFAWGVFAWVFLRIDRVFLRISDRLNGVEKSNVGMPNTSENQYPALSIQGGCGVSGESFVFL